LCGSEISANGTALVPQEMYQGTLVNLQGTLG
jgi:hypothetical protein